MNLDGKWIGKHGSRCSIIISGDEWRWDDGRSRTDSGKISHWSVRYHDSDVFEKWLINNYEQDEVETAKKIIESYDL